MNYNVIASRLREKITLFSGELCGKLGKIESRLVREMIYGMLASQSVLLTEIGRALEEKIPLRKTEWRLSRNLQNRNLGKRVEKALLHHASGYIKDDTLLIIDPGDISKKYAEKMEYLATVRDGSEGALGKGYSLLHIVGGKVKEDQIIPLIQRLYSSAAPGYNSENHQILDAVDAIVSACGGKGIHVFDRGGDRKNLLEPFLDRELKFIVRQVGNRHVCSGNQTRRVAEWAEICGCPYTEVISKIEKGSEKVYHLTFGSRKVRLPGRKEALTLLVVHGFGQTPLMLLINGEVKSSRRSLWWWVQAYMRRWAVEETIRCVKQSYDIENVRLLTYESLQNLLPLLNVAFYFTAIMIGSVYRLRVMAGYVLKAAKRLFGIPDFKYYALSDGLRAIFQQHPKRPDELSEPMIPAFPLFEGLGP